MTRQERRLAQALQRLQPAMRRVFERVIQDAALSVDTQRLTKLIEQNRIQEAVDLLRIDPSLLSPLQTQIQETYVAGGRLAEEEAPRGLSGVFRFDGTQTAAVQWVTQRAGTLIQGIQNDTLEMARRVITAGLDEGMHSSRIARSITGKLVGRRRVGGFLGLTTQQTDSIISGRAKLLSGDPAQMREYLDLRLRDRSYDGTIKKAIREGRAIRGPQLDRIIEAHRTKALGYRGRVIASHETKNALAAGRDEGMRQIAARDDVEVVTVRWQHNLSLEPRPDHVDMSGTVITLGERFQFPDGTSMRHPHDADASASHTIGCRCTAIYRVRLRRD